MSGSIYRMASSQSGSSFSGGSSHSMTSAGGGRGVGSGEGRDHRDHHHRDHHHHHREGRSSSSIGTGTGGIVRNSTAWFQRKIHLRPVLRGCHLITDEVLKQLPEMNEFAVGICHIQVMHTSASLALNEVSRV